MWECPHCNELIPDSKDKCEFCDIARPTNKAAGGNYCTNPNCSAYQVELDNADQKICRKCGELTSVGERIKEMI